MRSALFFIASLAWAGQSVVLTTSGGTSVDPNIFGQSFRVEFQVHNWSGSANATAFSLNGTGMQAGINIPTGPLISLQAEGYYHAGNCNVSLAGITNALVRMQVNPTGSAINGVPASSFVGEIWNYDATAYNSCSQTITGSFGNSATGGTFGGVTVDLGFLNVYTTLVPLGGQPPVTASRGDRTAITFDCTSSPSTCLTDLSGNGNNVTYSGASYVNTPNQVPVAFAKTLGAPAWSNWLSLRAGHSNQLDGTASYSLADSSSTVTCQWFQTGGPSNIAWGGTQTNCQPTLSGLLAGAYYFNLQVTDVNSNTAVAALNGTNGVGVVATDVNHVVVPANPAVTQIFGPQIAFGYNPWTYEDQQNLYAVGAQIPYQAAHNDFTWANQRAGTVSYPFYGKGFSPGPACTTLSAQMLVTDTTISITNGSCLSLSSLPTWLLVGSGNGTYEQVRVCSVASGSITSAVVMNICYDGRGVSGAYGYEGGMSSPIFPTATWPATSTLVGEMRIQGTSTQFLTDPNGAACPVAPGPMGTATAGTGTVSLTSGSYTVTGSGTGWTSGITTQQILISGTHSSVPFNFWAQLTYVSATSATMNRPAPAGMDSYSGLTYQLVAQTLLSLEVTDNGDGHIFRLLDAGQGCESQTAMFAVPYHDITGYDSTTQSGVHWAFKHFLAGYTSDNFSPEFYGSGSIMALSFANRSGYAPAYTLGYSVAEYYVRDPEVAEGISCNTPFACYGGIIGAAADLTTNPNTVLIWPNIETSASGGEISTGSNACNYTDTRDMGYQTAPLVFAANYDSNLTNRATFTTALATMLNWDLTCQRTTAQGYSAAEAGSFANSGYSLIQAGGPYGTTRTAVTLTNGSTAGTGTGFVNGSSSVNGTCYGVDSITLTVTNGSSTATVASGSLSQQNLLWFYDGTNTGVYAYTVTGSSVQLAGVWGGSSGTYNALSTGGGEIVNSNAPFGGYGAITVYTDTVDGVQPVDNYSTNEQLRKAWACKYNSSTSLTLFRPWDQTGGTYYISYNSVGAFHQQPYFDGILAYRLTQALNNSNSTTVSNAQSVLTNLGNWEATVGYDANNNHGVFYDTIQTACGSQADLNAGLFYSIHGQQGCGQIGNGPQYTSGPPEYAISRVNNVEAGEALMQYAVQNFNSTTQALVDTAYDAIFGLSGTCPTLSSPFCLQSSAQIATNYTNSNLGSYKWPGFFFGMGGFFTSTWPAYRQGGLSAAQPRGYPFGYPVLAGEDHRVVTVTQPSTATTQTTCTASPCFLPGFDARQGDGQIMYTVYNSGGGVIAKSTDPVIVKHVN
jgi:hypothetical protein